MKSYFMMEYNMLNTLIQESKRIDSSVIPIQGTVKSDKKPYKIIDSIAYISIKGVMRKDQVFSWWYSSNSCTTTSIRKALRLASTDADCKAIALIIDSPGGSVEGSFDLANDINLLKKKKPIYGYIEDCGCSAAYLYASQCTKVEANEIAQIGSIGVYSVLVDTSKMYNDMGVVVHLIKKGENKGIGVSGIPVDDGDLAVMQEEIDAIQKMFVKYIKRNRTFTTEQLAEITTAKTFISSTAMSLGLIDKISTIDQFHRGVQKMSDLLIMDNVEELEDLTEEEISKLATEVSMQSQVVPFPSPVVSAPSSLQSFMLENNLTEMQVVNRLVSFEQMMVHAKEMTQKLAIVALGQGEKSDIGKLIANMDYDGLMILQNQYRSMNRSQRDPSLNRQTVPDSFVPTAEEPKPYRKPNAALVTSYSM